MFFFPFSIGICTTQNKMTLQESSQLFAMEINAFELSWENKCFLNDVKYHVTAHPQLLKILKSS